MTYLNALNYLIFSYTILLFVSFRNPIYTQENTDNTLLIATKDLGNKNLIKENLHPIPTIEIKLSEDIYHYHIDTSQNKIYLRTREMNKKKKYYKPHGHITSLNMSTYKLDWQDNINYNKSSADIKNRYMVLHRLSKNVMVDLVTGEDLWEVKNRIYYTFFDKNVAMGYQIKGIKQKSKTLQGLDMLDGKVIWEREIDRTYGWRQLFSLNDSTLIISGSGIHSLNYKDGQGWSIEQTAGKDKVNLWRGTKRFFNLGSNIVMDTIDKTMYQAAEEIIKFNAEGQIIWRKKLVVDEMSKMYLWQDERSLYLLNTGGSEEANLGYSHIGKPYFMSFDKETGHELLKTFINLSKKDYILDVSYDDPENVQVLSKNEVYDLDFLHGTINTKITLLKDIFGKQKRLINANCYILKNDSFVSLNEEFDFGIHNLKEKSLHFLSKDRKFTNLTFDEVYIKRELVKDELYLYHSIEKKSFIMDGKGNRLAELDILNRALFVNDKIYSNEDDIMRIHDLGKLIKQ